MVVTRCSIVQRDLNGHTVVSKTVKEGETPTDRLLNMLLCKDIILTEGDVIAVETEEVLL